MAKKIKKNPHYGFFSSQNRLEKEEKGRKQKLSFRFVPTRWAIENSKKIAKLFKKFKNTITASFQDKTAWKRLKKRENKNYRFVSFLHDA